MKKIIPNLWFDKEAEDAAKFYTTVFKESKINSITRYDKSGAEVSGQKEGSVLTVDFELRGQQFVAINGGPMYKFTPAVSFMITCESQDEVDHFWNRLAEGGSEDPCGWLRDKFGVSWQVVPEVLNKLLFSKDRSKSERAMKAMLQMKKLHIKTLEDAYEGR